MKSIATSRSNNKAHDYQFVCGVLLEILRKAPAQRVECSRLLKELRTEYGLNESSEVILKSIQKAELLLYPLVTCKHGTLRLSDSSRFAEARRASFFEERKGISTREKQAVAAYIHDRLLDELDAIFMDAGSACEAIAWEMALGDKGHFTVMTNNMRAVRAFLTRPTIRIRITGGTYVVDDEALVGNGAVFTPDEYSVKHAIVGASGITATHVYNHGIMGEEQIKRAYWQTPAQLLIVPATLRKFGGKDACCFGELFREKQEVSGTEGAMSIYDIVHNTIEDVRFSRRSASKDFSLHRQLRGFTAFKCKIIIEPEWLIDEMYRDQRERNALQAVVDEINQNSQASCVEVVHADTTPMRLKQSEKWLEETK